MRRILVDHARGQHAAKRPRTRVTFAEEAISTDQPSPAIGRADIDPYTGPFRADASP